MFVIDRNFWERATPSRQMLALTIWSTVLFVVVNWRNYINDFTPLALVPVTVLKEGRLPLDSYRPYYDQLPPGQKYTFVESGGHLYPMKPIGVSLLATPFFVPPVLAGVNTSRVDFWVGWGRIVNALFVGVSISLCYRIASRWTTPNGALLIAVAMAFGTGLWTQAANCLNYHAGALLVTSAILVLISHPTDRAEKWQMGIGFLFAISLAMRPTTGAYLLPIGLVHFFSLNSKSKVFITSGVAIGLIIPLGLNQFMFGHPLATGYSPDELDRWSTPFFEGLAGQLVSPNSGLLTQSPFLLLCAVGLVRGRSAIPWVCGLGFFIYVILFSKWYDWQGGLSFSARMLSEAYPLLVPLLAVGWESICKHKALVAIFAVAMIDSVGYQLVGIAWFDSISALDPPHRPWSPADHFYAVAVRANGVSTSIMMLSKTLLLFAFTAVTAAWVLKPLLKTSPFDQIQTSPPNG